jgi:hypothetical protein
MEAQDLSVDQAASQFEGLLSAEDGTQEPEEKQAEAADSSAGDEAEGEPAEEAEESEDAEQEGETEAEPSYTVKIDGKDAKVPVSELVKGYQRQTDYTKKTQQLAEERRELESVKAEREHYTEQLERVKALLEQAQPKEPDWDTLAQQDPAGAFRLKLQFDRNRDQLRAVEAEQAKVRAAQEADEAKSNAEFVAEQAKLLADAIPEWKDTATAKKEKANMVEFGSKHGYTPEELGQVTDHRAVVLLRKAMLFDQMQAKQAALKPGVPQPSVKPVRGGNASQSSQSAAAQAMKRLKQTGDQLDAAKVMEQFL